MLKDRYDSNPHPPATERLSLRETAIDDSAFILQLLTEPSWKRYIGKHEITSESDASEYIGSRFISAYKQGLGFWIVEQKHNGVPVGICGLSRRSYLDSVDLAFITRPVSEIPTMNYYLFLSCSEDRFWLS